MTKRTAHRRSLLSALGGAAAGTVAGCLGEGAGDDGFPSEEIVLVSPFAPGGGYDTYARLVAEHVDLPMRVENVTGAVGDVAMEQVYSAEPDGRTLMLSSLSIFPPRQLTEDVSYDMTELTYFPQVVEEVATIGGAAEFTGDWEGFVDRVTAGEVRFAGPPGGQTSFVASTVGHYAELWPPSAVLDNMVSVGGAAEMMTALQRGDIHAFAMTASTAAEYADTEGFDPLVVITDADDPSTEGIPAGTPTLGSLGMENASTIANVITQARVIVGPPDIPDARRERLEEALSRALRSDAFREAAAEAGRPVAVRSGPETRQKAIETVDGLRQLPFLDELS